MTTIRRKLCLPHFYTLRFFAIALAICTLLPSCRSLQALYEAAYEANNNKEYDTAINYCSQIIDIDSTQYKVFHLRGLVYNSQKKYQLAFEDANRSISLSPLSPRGYYLRAACYYQWGKYTEAIDDYSMLIKLTPSTPEPYFYRGMAYGKLQKYDSAIANYSRILRDVPKHYKAYQARAAIYSTQQNYDLALQDYDRAVEYLYEEILMIKHAPVPSSWRSSIKEEFLTTRSSTLQEYYEKLAWYLRERGLVYLALHKPSEGMIDFRESIQWDSVNASTYTAMSRAYYLQKDFASGIIYAQKAIHYQQSLLPPRYILALCTLCSGDISAALHYYREAVSFDANAPASREKAQVYNSLSYRTVSTNQRPVADAIQDLRDLVRQGIQAEEAKRILHDIFFTDVEEQ